MTYDNLPETLHLLAENELNSPAFKKFAQHFFRHSIPHFENLEAFKQWVEDHPKRQRKQKPEPPPPPYTVMPDGTAGVTVPVSLTIDREAILQVTAVHRIIINRMLLPCNVVSMGPEAIREYVSRHIFDVVEQYPEMILQLRYALFREFSLDYPADFIQSKVAEQDRPPIMSDVTTTITQAEIQRAAEVYAYHKRLYPNLYEGSLPDAAARNSSEPVTETE